MTRIAAIFGSIAGLILVASFAIGFAMGAEMDDHSPIMGYLIMLIALSMIFAGVKRYRDRELGGVIRFVTAFGMGLAIGGVAAIFYVAGWEAYMYATDYSFMPAYIDSVIEAERAKGTSPEKIAAMSRELQAFARQYANPVYRMAITLSEIVPVMLIVALVAAGLLRNSRFLPARAS